RSTRFVECAPSYPFLNRLQRFFMLAEQALSPSARLKSVAGIQRVPTPKVELFIVRGFADADSCGAFIERIDRKRRPSTIADDIGVANYRTSETCDLDSGDPLVAALDRRICELMGL